MQQLIDYFEKFLELDQREKSLVESRIIKTNLNRREKILRSGQICKHYSFVITGILKMYGLDDNGVQHNIQFAAENDWIMDIGSFHNQSPSRLFIEAIESSTLFQINQKDLYYLYVNIPKLDRIFKVIIENKYIELQNRVLQNFSSTAQHRYLDFLRQYPELSARLPNTQIASYIGITPEFLSKIRKELSQKK